MRVDQLDEPQLLGQGIKQGRGPKLPDLHGVELGELVGWGGGGELGTDLLYHPLPGSQVELLDDARVAVDPSRADPIEVGFAFFPFGDQAGHSSERVILCRIAVNTYL